MAELITQIDTDRVDDVWVSALADRLGREIESSRAGQCIRVIGAPRRLLERVASKLADLSSIAAEVYLVDRTYGPEPWRVGVHKVIERRNDAKVVVVAVIPSDVQLAAQDSIDVSTFREVSLTELEHEVDERLLDAMAPEVRHWAEQVVDFLVRRGWRIQPSVRHLYFATIAGQRPGGTWAVGGSLYALGLIPDFGLTDHPDDYNFRLGQRNIALVSGLLDHGRSVAERLVRLPLADEAFRRRLFELISSDGSTVEAWGARIATDNAWRDLSLDHWPFSQEVASPGEIRIHVAPLKLRRRTSDDLFILDAAVPLAVDWETTPPPVDVDGLYAFRIQVVTSDGVPAWESPLYPRGKAVSKKRTKKIKDLGLESGIYFIRVIAVTTTGEPFPLTQDGVGAKGKRSNESEDFLLEVGIPIDQVSTLTEAPTRTVARSYPDAEIMARWDGPAAGERLRALPKPDIAWATSAAAAKNSATATISFDLARQFEVRLSQRLRGLERRILDHPSDGGHSRLELDGRDHDEVVLPLELPALFSEARTDVFRAISSTAVRGDPPEPPVVALVDLRTIGPIIETYARAYLEWLETSDPSAVLLDAIRVSIPEYGSAFLVAPTHPLRLLWALQEHELGVVWALEAARRPKSDKGVLAVWQSALAMQNLPPVVVSDSEHGFVDAGQLVGGWGAYLPAQTRVARSFLATLRLRLGAGRSHDTEADIGPDRITDKLEAYLRQHPYVSTLVLNIVNPGDASLVADALVRLEGNLARRELRYEIRLFHDASGGALTGEALHELVDPDRQVSEEAARLAGPGRSFLYPKLAWSRIPVQELIDFPERYPADLTVILDAFPIAIRVADLPDEGRSSFIHGLVQEPLQTFLGQPDAYGWARIPAPQACTELSSAPGRSELIADITRQLAMVQAEVLAPGARSKPVVAVTQLDLSITGQALIYAAHTSSAWVITVDSHFGLDYFDRGTGTDRPAFLLDYTPEYTAVGSRQLLLTTNELDEVGDLVRPALDSLGIEEDRPEAAKAIIEALRSLSGRLALRLQSSPAQVNGVLGIALSRLFLEAYDLLADALVIPVDAHPELVDDREDPEAPRLRGDLLVVSADSEARSIEFLAVETKCLSGSTLSAEVRQRIHNQLGATEESLRRLFVPRDMDDRIDRIYQNWRLDQLATFYLGRSLRYGLTTPEKAIRIRRFLDDLDRGYDLRTRRIGLVFLLGANSTILDTEDPDLPIWLVGREVIDRCVAEAIATYRQVTEAGTAVTTSTTHVRLPETEPTWREVRETLGGLSTRRETQNEAAGLTKIKKPKTAGQRRAETEVPPNVGEAPAAEPPGPGSDAEDGDVKRQVIESNSEAFVVADPSASEHVDDGERSSLGIDVLLGDTRPSPQFGLLGTITGEAGRTVALDLNGCNTVSLFGVQGGGKSYTLGSIIEMALRPLPGLNELPHPLASVVFHYHATQDYPPEFVSMVEPNDDEDDLASLARLGGGPARLDDVMVLTTQDTVERRRREFPGLTIAPIAFASNELTVADWRFLMSATSNDALYLRQIDEVMRSNRDHLTIDAIEVGLRAAHLSDAQRSLAETRLAFAKRFIDDSTSIRSMLRPGRLIVVDLRDEFVQRDQALGLFVTLLNVFSGAGMAGETFNKLIVFDEAHKYMDGPVISHVVEVIREMRHKGVSVVIASQDPVNVPAAVIELSSVVALHRFNSPNWLRHIQRSLAALSDLTPTMLAGLGPGDAFVWSNKATDPIFTRRAVKVRMRPRATRHGGSTRNAVQ